MKIHNYEITEEQEKKINKIISDFLGKDSHVLIGMPPPTGRSANGKQFKLSVNDNRYVSIKLAHSDPNDIQWEIFNARMRETLKLPHYKLVKENDFPLPEWEKQDYIIIDWGVKDRRFHMRDSNVQQSLIDHKCELLFQLGQVCAQNYLFGTSDRKKEHFIWDLDEKVLFSIDHEIPTNNPHEVIDYFKTEIKSIFGNDWYDNEAMRSHFTDAFMTIWNEAESNKTIIVDAYIEFGLNEFHAKFIERVNVGSLSVLQRIMS